MKGRKVTRIIYHRNKNAKAFLGITPERRNRRKMWERSFNRHSVNVFYDLENCEQNRTCDEHEGGVHDEC